MRLRLTFEARALMGFECKLVFRSRAPRFEPLEVLNGLGHQNYFELAFLLEYSQFATGKHLTVSNQNLRVGFLFGPVPEMLLFLASPRIPLYPLRISAGSWLSQAVRWQPGRNRYGLRLVLLTASGGPTGELNDGATRIFPSSLLEAGVHFGHQSHRWNPKCRITFSVPHTSHHTILAADRAAVAPRAAWRSAIRRQGGRILVRHQAPAQYGVAEAAKRSDAVVVIRLASAARDHGKTISGSISACSGSKRSRSG